MKTYSICVDPFGFILSTKDIVPPIFVLRYVYIFITSGFDCHGQALNYTDLLHHKLGFAIYMLKKFIATYGECLAFR